MKVAKADAESKGRADQYRATAYAEDERWFHLHVEDWRRIRRGDTTQGLGDRVESLIDTATLGLAKKLARSYEQVTGRPCGCSERREALNEWGRKRA